MNEREPHDHPEADPYWTDDLAIGEGTFYRDETHTIRMRLHTATERAARRREIVPLSDRVTEKVYVQGKPYILVPDITLTVGLYEQPDPTGAIGQVEGSEWAGMRHEDIGHAQAWHYPADRLTILWECYLHDRYRGPDPSADANLRALWRGFEAHLLDRFPETERLVTTWEDIYDRPTWEEFLSGEGYRKIAPAAFLKEPRER